MRRAAEYEEDVVRILFGADYPFVSMIHWSIHCISLALSESHLQICAGLQTRSTNKC